MSTESTTPGRVLVPPTSDDRFMWDLWLSNLHFPALTVADELGLFPLLASAPATAEEVGSKLALGLHGSEALLGLLAALGLLVQHQGRFHLTDVARTYLLPDSLYYYGPALRLFREQPMTHETLRATLQGEKPYLDKKPGKITDAMQAGDWPSAQAEALTHVIYSYSLPAAVGVARQGNFTGVQRLLDVGGGSGCFCIALAQRYPQMRFTVLELPTVCPITLRYSAMYGVEDRVDTLAANMFEDAWPTGYDAVFLSNVLHMWNKENCLLLARRSFEALPPGGRIYLHEMLLNETKDGPLAAVDFSLIAFATSWQGKQYSATELADLLKEAGFTNVLVTATYAYYSLISATKPM
jgi:hypothetical protein